MDSFGLQSAIEQQEGLTQQSHDMNNFIQQENNKAMSDYHTKLTTQAGLDAHEDELNLGKIGLYSAEGLSKVQNYRKLVKSGDLLPGLKGSKIFGALTGKSELEQRPEIDPETYKGTTASLKDIAGSSEATGKLLGDDEWIDTETPDEPEKFYKPTEPTKILGRSGQGESFLEKATREGTGEIMRTPAMKGGASTLEKAGNIAGDFAGDIAKGDSLGGKSLIRGFGGAVAEGVGRAAGGIMGGAFLGDDIYNQVKDKKFFTGDNTGDKIGNFMNEAGSVMDVVGSVTADPFMIMAGVGIGAVGSVVSEVSELIHHKTEEKSASEKKPALHQFVGTENIAGSGQIAQEQKSTLKAEGE